jgi:hypothetical protein
METHFSLGTYSINGISISYNATSILPKEMIELAPIEIKDNKADNEAQLSSTFDNVLKGTINVPNPE